MTILLKAFVSFAVLGRRFWAPLLLLPLISSGASATIQFSGLVLYVYHWSLCGGERAGRCRHSLRRREGNGRRADLRLHLRSRRHWHGADCCVRRRDRPPRRGSLQFRYILPAARASGLGPC
jgi:hypothetical protein